MKYKFLLVGIVFGLLLSNCSKEEGYKSSKSAINFNLKSIDTKTEYKEDGFSMRWTTGDAVTIFCEQADGVKKSNYDVVVNGDSKTSLVFRKADDKTQLFWGANGVEHHFYAVYPVEDNDRVTKAGNELTLKINSELNGTLDMKNAYLVADTKIKKEEVEKQQVDLLFKPIMTTYDVTIQNNCSKEATIYQIFFTYNDTKGYINNGTFKYDLTTGKAVEGFGAANKKVSFAYSINDMFGMTLAAGATITFKMFLPPVEDISSTNPLVVKVNGTTISSNQSVSGAVLTIPCSVKGNITNSTAKYKANIKIGLEESDGGNLWIDDMDDNMLLSKMSIPGTAFSCTSGCGGYKVQLISPEQEWNVGMRAFDFHGTSNNNLEAYNYSTKSGYSIFDLLSLLKTKIDASNKREFAVIFFRVEQGTQSNAEEQWKRLETTYWNNYSSYAIKYNPNLTVGQLRGKILLIGLEWGTENLTNNRFSGNIAADQWPGEWGGYLTCYKTNAVKEGTITASTGSHNGVTGTNGRILAQDYLSIYGDAPGKVARIWEQLEKLKNNAGSYLSFMALNCFLLNNYNTDNNASAYDQMLALPSTVNGSYEDGESVFKKYYGISPFGIVMMPFVSTQKWKNQYPTRGDVLPSMIIANNYLLMNKK